MLDPDLDVLLVDDDPVTLRMITAQLHRLGVQHVREAVDGMGALDAITEREPQLIITDWSMPNINGFQLLQIIRKHLRLTTLPILMITSRDDREYVLTAIREGVSAYIVKPFDAPTLAAKLAQMLRQPTPS